MNYGVKKDLKSDKHYSTKCNAKTIKIKTEAKFVIYLAHGSGVLKHYAPSRLYSHQIVLYAR